MALGGNTGHRSSTQIQTGRTMDTNMALGSSLGLDVTKYQIAALVTQICIVLDAT